MPSRRTFLLSSGLTAAMSRSAMGPADRIRMGVIGTGTRGSYMATVLAPNADCEIVAMCDVYKRRNLDQAATKPKSSCPDPLGLPASARAQGH